MSDLCDDNRFELIEKYKKELIDATNIETAPDEMAVLDDILFRFWQMGWLDSVDRMPLVKESARTLMHSAGNSISAKAFRKAGRFVQNAIDGEPPEFEKLPSAQPQSSQGSTDSSQGLVNDTISRQATITEIKNYERDSTTPIDYVKIVEQMPPAQPDARYINATELIKRLQQAGLDDAVSIAVKMAGHERLKHVPSAQPDLIAKIQNRINATNANDSYSCGMRNGMRWCMSLVDGKEPLFENCPSVQPEREKGKWIPISDGYVDIYECNQCGDTEDYERNFCPNCGADMRGLE